MRVSSLLLLVFSLCDGERGEGVLSPEDRGSRLRGFWKVHMRDVLLRGGGSPPPIRDRLRQQLLYCRVGIGYHLQILTSGAVRGVHKPTEDCWLRVFSMRHGVVAVRGVRSSRFLCLGGDGLAYGAEKFSDDCLLKENLEENHYTTYSSLAHPGVYLALSHKGELRKGNAVGRHHSCTHFLPRRSL